MVTWSPAGQPGFFSLSSNFDPVVASGLAMVKWLAISFNWYECLSSVKYACHVQLKQHLHCSAKAEQFYPR